MPEIAISTAAQEHDPEPSGARRNFVTLSPLFRSLQGIQLRGPDYGVSKQYVHKEWRGGARHVSLRRASILWSCIIGVWLGTFTVAQTPPDVQDLVFQVSTLPALSAGVFDGDTTVAELKRHGNFGLGTFNGVDGEMIVLDGEVYQVKSDGKAQIAASAVKTPFAAVTAFSPDRTLATDMPMSCTELETFISTLLPSPNTIYALKVDGAFETLKVRSEARQSPPYTTLAEVLGEQVVFDYQRLSGTMVGFWFPQYTQGVNATGYHFHFLSADRKMGGHVLDCSVQQAQISLDASNGLSIMLPDTDAFLNADLAD